MFYSIITSSSHTHDFVDIIVQDGLEQVMPQYLTYAG